MSTTYITPTAHQDAASWDPLSEDIRAEYTRVQKAVFKINEKLIRQGAKHKLIYTDKAPHYSYRSY